MEIINEILKWAGHVAVYIGHSLYYFCRVRFVGYLAVYIGLAGGILYVIGAANQRKFRKETTRTLYVHDDSFREISDLLAYLEDKLQKLEKKVK